jgi:hypothetical protein
MAVVELNKFRKIIRICGNDFGQKNLWRRRGDT